MTYIIKLINKDGNLVDFDTRNDISIFSRSEKVGNVYFEKREEINEVNKEEKSGVTSEEKGLDYYVAILKDNGVKATHLIKDIEKAKEKCKKLGLL